MLKNIYTAYINKEDCPFKLEDIEIYRYFKFIARLPITRIKNTKCSIKPSTTPSPSNSSDKIDVNKFVTFLKNFKAEMVVSSTMDTVTTKNFTYNNFTLKKEAGTVPSILYIIAEDGDLMPFTELQDFILLQSLLPSGQIRCSTLSQSSAPALSSVSPWVFYAFKLHKDIKYQDWRGGPDTYDALTYLLPPYYKLRDNKKTLIEPLGSSDKYTTDKKFLAGETLLLTKAELLDISELTRTSAKGKISSEFTYKLNKSATGLKGRTSLSFLDDSKGLKEQLVDTRAADIRLAEKVGLYTKFDKLSRITRRMLVQTWLLHPSVRTDALIMDPTDWDAVPLRLQSIEAEVPLKEKPAPTLTGCEALNEILDKLTDDL